MPAIAALMHSIARQKPSQEPENAEVMFLVVIPQHTGSNVPIPIAGMLYVPRAAYFLVIIITSRHIESC